MSNGRSKNQQLLLDIVRDEVVLRLEQSLHNRIYIITDKEEDPSQVKPPWAIDIQIGAQPKFQLPPDTKITNIYDREDIQGRLLILGAPGSGKTTTLLQLAQELIIRAKEDSEQPIPILLNLSSWTEEYQSLKNWIIADLNIKYGVLKRTSIRWLNEEVIIPLLDGLDELAPAQQEKCVEQINEFLQLKPDSLDSSNSWSISLVVCSRTEEYQYLFSQLRLNGSIILQPLTKNQIRNYVLKTKGEELWNSLINIPDLMELASTPLFLNILSISSQEISFDIWQNLNSSQDRITSLFDIYISTMLNRSYNKEKPQNEKTKYWLAWLANQLTQKNKTEFFLENLQPSWLKNNNQKFIYQISICINLAIVFGINGIVGGLIFCLIWGVKEESINSTIARNIINRFFALLLFFTSIPTRIPPNMLILSPPIIQTRGNIAEIKKRKILIKELEKNEINYYNRNGYFSQIETFIKSSKSVINFSIYDSLLYGLIGGFCSLSFFLYLQMFSQDSESKIIDLYFIVQIFWTGASGFLSGFLVGIAPNFIQNVKIDENLKWSINLSFEKGIYFVSALITIVVLIISSLIGIITTITLSSNNINFNDQLGNLLSTILFKILSTTLSLGLTGFVICGLTSSEIEFKTKPNQGIYKCLVNATIIGIILAIFSGMINGFFYSLGYHFTFGKVLLLSAITGLFHGLMGALLGGGVSCLQHFTLRLILYQDGSIPWNYPHFLDYATNRLFLQKVGGGYRFIHKLLQDHFAQKEFE